MSQLRLNPLNGRWVTIVAQRAERPYDFAPRTQQVEADPSRACPFCPGSEDATPPALETQGRDGAWQVHGTGRVTVWRGRRRERFRAGEVFRV